MQDLFLIACCDQLLPDFFLIEKSESNVLFTNQNASVLYQERKGSLSPCLAVHNIFQALKATIFCIQHAD